MTTAGDKLIGAAREARAIIDAAKMASRAATGIDNKAMGQVPQPVNFQAVVRKAHQDMMTKALAVIEFNGPEEMRNVDVRIEGWGRE